MGVTYNPRIVTDGLVLALDAANPKSYPGSGTTWNDLSGQGNNASLNDGAYFSDNSILFDGDNDGVDLGKSYFETIDEFSVVIWFKPDGVKGGTQMLIYEGQGDGFGGNDEFHVQYDSGSSDEVAAWMTGGIAIGSGTGTVPVDKFSQVAYTVSGISATATGTLYLNGVNEGTGTGTINRSGYGVNTLVGRPYSLAFPTPPRSYEGLIQTVSIYNRALTESEIQQNFNALRSRFSI